MSRLNKTKQFAIGAVARHFSIDCQIGAFPPDAYATIGGRSIALEVAVLAPARAVPPSAARLREDAVARRVLREIEGALRAHVPMSCCVILTLGAPIKVPTKLLHAVTTLLVDYIQSGRNEREESKTVLGNRVRFRVVKRDLRWVAKLVGFVFSGDPKPGLLANAMRSLNDAIAAAAIRRPPKSFSGDRWLILSSDAWIADIKAYRQMHSLLSPSPSFNRILMVFNGGRVEELGIARGGCLQ
jgi:hypothetical protein